MSNSNVPLVSVIILNYNGKKDLRKCFNSIIESNYPKEKLEIIFVDNASTDGSPSFIKENFQEALLIESGENKGWSSGNNIGAQNSRGEVLIFLNPDTKVEKKLDFTINFFSQLQKGRFCIAQVPFYGKAGNNKFIRSIFFLFGVSGAIGKNSFSSEYRNVLQTFGPTGACLAIKRETFFDLDCFNEIYFMYMEDVDFGWKIQNNNLKSVVNCNSIIYHKSHSTNYEMFYRNVFRNTTWMIICYSPYGLIIPMLIMLFISTISFTVILLLAIMELLGSQ